MGQGLAGNVARKFAALGYDTADDACDRAAAQGVSICASPNEVLEMSDVVILSLPTEKVVNAVISESIGSGSLAGTVIFDTSTTTPEMAESLSRQCVSLDSNYLDAPVTGGIVGAESGELSIMVGGDKEAFESNLDVLQAIGNTITRIGPSGHGQVAKMVNQMLMAAIYTSVNEAFGFAVQHGADIEKIFRAVEGGGGRSMLLNNMKKSMLEGTLHSDFSLRQHGKDITYAMKAASRKGIELPITSGVDAFFRRSCEAGFEKIWAGEMWAVWEKLFGVNFRDTIGWEDRDSSNE